jgi:predicted extracellular nuclease
MPSRFSPETGLLLILPAAATLLVSRFPVAPAPLDTTIPAIQGRGHYSPLAGRQVRLSGVVTSVAREIATVQDPVGDRDSATSDAVMIQLPAAARPRPGDRVSVSGTVAETVPGGERTPNLSVTTIVRARIRTLGRAGLPRPIPIGATPGTVREIISADELPVNLREWTETIAQTTEASHSQTWKQSLERPHKTQAR